MKFYSISKRRFLITGMLIVMIATGTLWYLSNRDDYPTVSLPGGKAQVFQLVTGEFSSELPGGKRSNPIDGTRERLLLKAERGRTQDPRSEWT
ncbi:hypothetical protein ACPJHQ_14230 [Rossellomorea sp. H39__3]